MSRSGMHRPMNPLHICASEVELSAICAQGPGGQNVNKVATAIQLRFDVRASSLPKDIKARWLASSDSRLTPDGVLLLKAQRYRTQQANRQDAWTRLDELLARYAQATRPRKATQPTPGSVQRRLQSKARRAQLKASRRSWSD